MRDRRRMENQARMRTENATVIDVQIDELVLRGFSGIDRHAVGDALVEELRRLLSDRGKTDLTGSDISRSYVRSGDVDFADGQESGLLGSRIAGSVYAGLPSGAKDRHE